MNKEDAMQLLAYSAYIGWEVGTETATLDGEFTVEELEAVVWCMRNGVNIPTERCHAS